MAKSFFKHDFNARTDPKILDIRAKFNLEGYGVFWCLVEIMHEQGGYIQEGAVNGIAYELHVSADVVKSILGDFGLFTYNKKDKKYCSKRVLDSLETIKSKTENAKIAAQKRWGTEQSQCEPNASAMQTHNKCNAKAMQSQCEPNASAMQIRLDKIRLDNSESINTHACEDFSVSEVLAICQSECPIVLSRHKKDPVGDYRLETMLDELRQSMKLDDIRKLLAKANRTYIALKKYDTLGLLWVLDHQGDVWRATDIDNSMPEATEPPQKTQEHKAASDRAQILGDKSAKYDKALKDPAFLEAETAIRNLTLEAAKGDAGAETKLKQARQRRRDALKRLGLTEEEVET